MIQKISSPLSKATDLSKAKPFLKWAGGKRSLLRVLKSRLPKVWDRYYEPFVGGGALLFDLQPKNAVISDINVSLMITYKVIQNSPDLLIESLKNHKQCHSRDYYYQLRLQHDIQDPIELASRFIYLNKTCYNGLYRVNLKGDFNVPIGSYLNPMILDENNIWLCHHVLQSVKIQTMYFDDIFKKPSSMQPTDFIYFDPPYDPIDSGSFTHYVKNGFKQADQEKLYQLCVRLNKHGVRWIVSNSDTQFIRRLYKRFHIYPVQTPRLINCNGQGRSQVDDLIIQNYEP